MDKNMEDWLKLVNNGQDFKAFEKDFKAIESDWNEVGKTFNELFFGSNENSLKEPTSKIKR